jgi:hypothetical protein
VLVSGQKIVLWPAHGPRAFWPSILADVKVVEQDPDMGDELTTVLEVLHVRLNIAVRRRADQNPYPHKCYSLPGIFTTKLLYQTKGLLDFCFEVCERS